MRTYLFLLFLFVPLFNYSQDGSLDTTFDVGSGANGNVYLTKQLPNGKILIGGQFTSYDGNSANGIARLNSDGSFDSTFNMGSGINFRVSDALIESDGKIVIVGEFSTYNGVARNCIVRINADGTLDPTFNISSGAILSIDCVSKQNEKYIITGTFSLINNVNSNHIARLNSDGTSDTTFNSNGVSGNGNVGIAENIVLNDGKIMIVGAFTSCQNQSRNRIARLNADGTLDTSFNPGLGANSNIFSIALQNDNKFIIGGNFAQYNGVIKQLIARINSDGTLDTSFSFESGYEVMPTALVYQNDGKIIVGGWTALETGNDKYLARLNSNGSFDPNFDTGTDFDNPINCLSLQTDGKILVGGWFTNYNGTNINRVLRLNNELVLAQNEYEDNQSFHLYPNPTNAIVTIDLAKFSDKNVVLTLMDTAGKQLFKTTSTSILQNTIDLSTYSSGIYFLKLTSEGLNLTKKIIKL